MLHSLALLGARMMYTPDAPSSIAICKAGVTDIRITCAIGDPNVTEWESGYTDGSWDGVTFPIPADAAPPGFVWSSAAVGSPIVLPTYSLVGGNYKRTFWARAKANSYAAYDLLNGLWVATPAVVGWVQGPTPTYYAQGGGLLAAC